MTGMGIPAASAQGPAAFFSGRPVPMTVYISQAGTVYSADTHANADLLRAVGSARLDTASAWLVAQDAYRKALENSELQVSTYFRRRLLHDEYCRMLKQASAGAPRYVSPGEELYLKARQGDFTKELNWLFLAVFEQRVADNSPFKEAVASPKPDFPAEQLAHLWLTDRPETGIRFRASDGIPLKTENWPHLLKSPALDEVRKTFEQTRDQAIREIESQGAKSYFMDEEVVRTQEKLVEKFHEEYAFGRSGCRPFEYAEACGFLRSLRFQVYRFVRTNPDQKRLQFRGNRLAELIDHLGAQGLYFAKPEHDDEGTYQAVFVRLQDMYARGHNREGTAATAASR
jgi:hypothetical protein